MPNFFFTGIWGAIYLGLLAGLMVPSLFVLSTRNFAAIMILTWLMERLALASVGLSEFLLIMGGIYFGFSVLIFATYDSDVGKVISSLFALISGVAILGFLGIIAFDIAASIREAAGLIIMLTIFGSTNGTLVAITRKARSSISNRGRSIFLFRDDKGKRR